MIVVRLIGGLGNQMFQYAAGRRAALVHGLPLRLDGSAFEPRSTRQYSLHRFEIEETFATRETLVEIHGPKAPGLARAVHRLRRRLRIGYRWNWIVETRLSAVDPRVIAAGSESFLDGYWQSEKYFSDVAETIRRDFTNRLPTSNAVAAIGDEIAGTNSVSIHLRRGDYVSNPRTNQAHGTCSLDYYRRSVAILASRVPRPHFFLFSDDPAWAVANLVVDHPMTLVSGRVGGDEHDDLRLMRRCRHHIIANSSFSWWGAWLNPDPDKIVVAPKRWGNDPSWDDRDLIPSDWLRI